MIRKCGILQRRFADEVGRAYQFYRRRGSPTAPSKARALAFRQQYAVANETRIHFVGVFDTVGALGIPAPFLGTLGTTRHLFHDTEPSRIIRHARHAVAIDENRQDFEPALWRDKPGIDLKQVWFAGAHTDIGGGYADRALGDHAGQWMATEAEACGLALSDHFTSDLQPDHTGTQHNEYKGFYRALRRRLERTVEPVVHWSVKARWEDDAVNYRSPALKALLEEQGGWQAVATV